MGAWVVLAIGVAGLTIAALLVAREPDRRVRRTTVAGAAGGFLLALLLALALDTGARGAVATAALGAAVLALALIGQWRLFRSLFGRAGRRL